jgi:energy-coupling factor transporter ATP-binding protein EcfA2
MVIDSEVFRSQLIIDRVLYAALKADAFLIIKNAELITAKFASVLVEKLAMIQKLRETPDATIVLGANSISANRLQSRVCLLVHESSSVVDSDWTYKHRLVFRPIHVEKLPRNILFQSLLLSVGYMDYIAMAARFDCVVVYILSTYESFKEESVMKVLIDSIRVVGLDASLVSKYRKATLEVIKCFVSKLALLDRRIDVFDVICRCCLYMKTNVHGDNENGEDLTLDAPKADISRYEMLLTTVKETNSVIVTGPCGCGKTTSIKNVFQDLYSAVAQSDDFVYQSTSFRTVVLTEVIGITMKAASTDPITVMTEMEDYITDLVAQLPESRKSLHVVHVDTSYLAYTSLLTRWCSLTFQARRPDVKFLWEVGDTHGFEPSVLQDVPIVTLEMQEYGVSEILGFHIELTAEKIRCVDIAVRIYTVRR